MEERDDSLLYAPDESEALNRDAIKAVARLRRSPLQG